jgi:propionyl-CoA synthetase
MGNYDEMYRRSIEDPEGFWGEAAESLVWEKKWDRVLDASNVPFYRWFQGGELNTCYNAVDHHVAEGRGDQKAIIYDSPITGVQGSYTYAELQEQVAKLAGAIAATGVSKGDRVIVYMPMVPEALMAMLACARLGAVHSVVFGGFAAKELATRIDDAKPKLILSASCGIEPGRVIAYKPLLDEAIDIASHKVDHTIILQREQAVAELQAPRDLDWAAAAAAAEPHACVPVAATDPLYILYTSGTTGQPKGVVRDNGGHAVALKWSMQHIYNVAPGEVYWAASDVGWVVGHSYICYGPLLNGNTTIVFEGKPVGTPDPGTFWRVISEHGVKKLFTAPTAFRAIRKEDPEGSYITKYDLSNFEALFLAGERCDPDTLYWAQEQLKVPVIDHWWQTETGWPMAATGWPMAANCLGIESFEIKAGSPTKAVPGYDIQVLDEEGQQVPAGEIGAIVVKLPLPPGTLPTLWGADERYVNSYLSRYINVAGHRLSTGAMEEVLASHEAVAECAVFGVADQLKGELPLGMVVLKAGSEVEEETLRKELVTLVRQKIGPVAAFKLVTTVKRLPKTRSGKILRGTMKKIADGQEYKVP